MLCDSRGYTGASHDSRECTDESDSNCKSAYDVKCVEGFGIFDYDVTVSAGYENYMGMLIGNEESGFPQELKNIVLIDGTEVDLEGLTVELTPSEWIESEEYESFYDNYY